MKSTENVTQAMKKKTVKQSAIRLQGKNFMKPIFIAFANVDTFIMESLSRKFG